MHKTVLVAGLLLILPISAAFAETPAPSYAGAWAGGEESDMMSELVTPSPAPQPSQQQVDKNSFLQGMQEAMKSSSAEKKEKEERDLGSISDPNSLAYKTDKLAKKARAQRQASDAMNGLEKTDDVMNETLPPPEVETLQWVNESNKDKAHTITDDPVNKEIGLDMRKGAQREAALSYGARGGLAKRNYQIMERMKGFDPVLDKVFNFRQLLIKTPSGLLIEPPIIKESVDAMIISQGGAEAAVADKVFDINKKANIVSAPRDWRQYLIQVWSDVPPPPYVLWPKNKQEQADWNSWIQQGWDAGFVQAEQIFESNVNRLVADYNGMVRYKLLVEQGMISEPYALHEDRGVTGDKNQMRVGDRALRITGPSQFLTGADLWTPADR